MAWTLFVWGHSMMGITSSLNESGRFVALVRPAFEAVGVHDVDVMSFIVRKGAHMSEYAVLGALAMGTLRARALEGRAWRPHLAPVFALCVASLDECIQIFSPGRSSSVRDVLIDLSGAVVGCLVMWAVTRGARSD